MLTASQLRKSYGDKLVLNGVGVALRPGTITALIGPSGGGKSTFLRTLALLEWADSGTIKVDDHEYVFPDVAGTNPAPPWPKLTVVFQQFFLWPHLTLRQNITLPLAKHDAGHKIGRLNGLIDKLGMHEFIDRYPNEVSMGQRQRVAVARAIALAPKYLLLDEITSALDVEHVSAILDYLKYLRDQETGILLVTHLIGFASKTADQVLFLDQGEVLETGGPEILACPRSARLAEFLSLVVSAT